jgi:hypothetical protein
MFRAVREAFVHPRPAAARNIATFTERAAMLVARNCALFADLTSGPAPRSGWHVGCLRSSSPAFRHGQPRRRLTMKLTRTIFLALAVLVPTSWTIAKAEDAPPADGAKKEKKSKKSKKAEGDKKDEKKAE